jgi:ligand-binding SRPBCC domain-containing protein
MALCQGKNRAEITAEIRVKSAVVAMRVGPGWQAAHLHAAHDYRFHRNVKGTVQFRCLDVWKKTHGH